MDTARFSQILGLGCLVIRRDAAGCRSLERPDLHINRFRSNVDTARFGKILGLTCLVIRRDEVGWRNIRLHLHINAEYDRRYRGSDQRRTVRCDRPAVYRQQHFLCFELRRRPGYSLASAEFNAKPGEQKLSGLFYFTLASVQLIFVLEEEAEVFDRKV